ncbi:MAG: HipA domain-containing protein [Bacilli bacterium]|nr:HipA domain-containing protein [Bacilli bacterium]
MERVDFSKCRLSGVDYGGSEEKLGIVYKAKKYMLKFKKKNRFSIRDNDLSEFIGSHIYRMLGYEVQETILGTYQGECVVACRDFLQKGARFVAFNALGESTIDTDMDHHKYSYDEILCLLEANKKLVDPQICINNFFEMFIVDALIGNFDRHGGNWGFLKKENVFSLSPVFDNGSSLFPNLTDDDEMEKIINDQEQIDVRVYDFPTSQILLNDKKSSYFEVISSLSMKEVNDALMRVFPKIDIHEICDFIDTIDVVTKTHRLFYKTMLVARYEKILKESYLKLTRQKQ